MIAEFETVDKRARDYIKSGDHLMAADVIFSEGGDTATRRVAGGGRASWRAPGAPTRFEADRRKTRRSLGAGAGLMDGHSAAAAATPRSRAASSEEPAPDRADADRRRTRTSASKLHRAHVTDSHNSRGPVHRVRSRSLSRIEAILARAAEVLDASGLVVWIGSTTGLICSRWFPTATPRKWWRGCRPCPAADNAAAAAIGPDPCRSSVEAGARRPRRAAPRRRRLHRSAVGGDSRGWRRARRASRPSPPSLRLIWQGCSPQRRRFGRDENGGSGLAPAESQSFRPVCLAGSGALDLRLHGRFLRPERPT
jgi:hypothetical protein